MQRGCASDPLADAPQAHRTVLSYSTHLAHSVSFSFPYAFGFHSKRRIRPMSWCNWVQLHRRAGPLQPIRQRLDQTAMLLPQRRIRSRAVKGWGSGAQVRRAGFKPDLAGRGAE